jgi:hypothetical protein
LSSFIVDPGRAASDAWAEAREEERRAEVGRGEHDRRNGTRCLPKTAAAAPYTGYRNSCSLNDGAA